MVEMQHQRHPRTPTHARQRAISLALGVSRTFDAASELDLRIAFLESTLENTGKTGYVLGISGGVDSLVAGKLAQSAVRRLRDRGRHASFVAVRLPYGHQHDEQDAALAVDFLAPDHCIQVDIKMGVDAQREALSAAGLIIANLAVEDFIVGNMKARQRVLAQYAIAGAQEAWSSARTKPQKR